MDTSSNKLATKVLVLLSGGQDSMTCLALAIERYGYRNVCALSFGYEQRHQDAELRAARKVCEFWDVRHTTVYLGNILKDLGRSALTHGGDVSKPHPDNPTLPASFVPGRNAVFLTLAHAYAKHIEAEIVYAGMCQTDFSGYPDCRREFIDLLQSALNTGYQTKIRIVTPLMYLTKGQTFAKAHELGKLETVLEMSHTCYNGEHLTRHVWGYGCGKCPACNLRERGYIDFLNMPIVVM